MRWGGGAVCKRSGCLKSLCYASPDELVRVVCLFTFAFERMTDGTMCVVSNRVNSAAQKVIKIKQFARTTSTSVPLTWSEQTSPDSILFCRLGYGFDLRSDDRLRTRAHGNLIKPEPFTTVIKCSSTEPEP